MLIVFLSCLSEDTYQNIKEFRTTAEQLGADFLHINLYKDKVEAKGDDFIVNGKKYDLSEAVVLKRKWAMSKYGLEEPKKKLASFKKIFTKYKVPIINTAKAIELCRSKWMTYNVLLENGVQTIPTIKVNAENLGSILERTIFPCVVKPDEGTKGKDVICFNSMFEAMSKMQSLFQKYKFMLLQPKIDIESDIRMHVVCTKAKRTSDPEDYEVIGAMKRTAPDNDFRTNFSIGGSIQLYVPTPEESLTAIQAAIATGCRWCGVDLLYDKSDNKVKVIEVNSSPGITGINSLYAPGEKNITYRLLSVLSGYFSKDYEISEGKKTIVSFHEHIKLDGIDMIGCFDTGKEGNTASLTVEDLKDNGDTVTFKLLGKEITKKKDGTVTIGYKGAQTKIKRICVWMKISINGKEKKIPVTLKEFNSKTDRESVKKQLTIGTDIIHDFGFIVSPDRKKTFLLGESKETDWKQRVCFLRSEWPDNLKDITISRLVRDLFYFPNIKDEYDKGLTKDMPLINYINDGSKNIEFYKKKYSQMKNLKNNFDVLSICNDKLEFYKSFMSCGFIPATYDEETIRKVPYDQKIIKKPARDTHSGIGITLTDKGDIIRNGMNPEYIYSQYIDVKDEYRILLYNNEIMLCYRRRPMNKVSNKLPEERVRFVYEPIEPDAEFLKKIHEISDVIYNKIDCNGLIGLDIMVDGDGKMWCPEINSRSGLCAIDFIILYFFVLKHELGINISDDMMRYCYDNYLQDFTKNYRQRLLKYFEPSENNIDFTDYDKFKNYCNKL